MDPLISVVTITYNAEKTISVTLKSLREQSFRDFEHVVVDGASTDHTLGIVREFGYPSIRILSEPDKGLYDAMNKGLRMAKGKYVLFLNAGDSFSSPDELGFYAGAARLDPDIIYADTRIVDKDRNVLGPRHLSVPDKLTRDSFKRGMLICHQAFMVRKSLAPEYDLNYRFSADYDWCVKCIARTLPEHCVNLKRVTIDYLSDGLTDNHKIESLMERYAIMSKHYGTVSATLANLSFIPRMIKRRMSK